MVDGGMKTNGRGATEHLRERLSSLALERDRERAQLTDQIEDLRRRLDAEAARLLSKRPVKMRKRRRAGCVKRSSQWLA